MRVKYDRGADAAYISLIERIAPGEAKRQEVTESGLVLDFDAQGRLLGIEVLDPRRMLRPETLDAALTTDWVFSVAEVSAGVYEAIGRDGSGRTVAAKGTNADALLAECHGAATRLDAAK
jgi:uncharacterized protein YuzE